MCRLAKVVSAKKAKSNAAEETNTSTDINNINNSETNTYQCGAILNFY